MYQARDPRVLIQPKHHNEAVHGAGNGHAQPDPKHMEMESHPSSDSPQSGIQTESEPTFFIDISEEDLRRVLEEHRTWGDTGGKLGKRANLERVNLGGADLHGVNLSEANLVQANLSKANLQGASLAKANLQGALLGGANLSKASLWESDMQGARLSLANLQEANLTQTNLEQANLREANLSRANLTRANLQRSKLSLANFRGCILGRANFRNASLNHTVLHEASLQEADFDGATGLQITQLRGANVSSANLPQYLVRFEWLERVEEASKKAGNLFIVVLACTLYALLIILSTQDVYLVTSSATFPLPILGTLVPLVWLYWIAPAALLMLFIYFHLNLQRLWEDLSAFPAVFPDGKTLDKKVYPWLLNGLTRAYLPQLKENHLPFFSLQKAVSVISAWCTIPAAIGGFLYAYLPRQDEWGTLFILCIFLTSAWLAISFFMNTSSTMRGMPRRPFRLKERLRDMRFRIAMGVVVLAIAGWAVLFWGPVKLPTLNLVGADLRGAELSHANLEGANMDGADLRSANLQHARLDGATLFSAQMDHVDLTHASLRNSDLKAASILGSNLNEVLLIGADLRGASLQGSTMAQADLSGANLSRALLQDVVGITYEQLCKVQTMKGAMLDDHLIGQVTQHCVERLMETPETAMLSAW